MEPDGNPALAGRTGSARYCDDPDNCGYADCPTAFCDRNLQFKPTQQMKHTEVKLELLVGNRKLCEIMSNAGLGVTGIGSREIYALTYAPGEVVDEKRIEIAVNKVRTQMDQDNDEFQILSYEILEIKEVE